MAIQSDWALAEPANLDNYWGYGMVMVLTAILLVMVAGSQSLSRKHKRIVYRRIHGQELVRE